MTGLVFIATIIAVTAWMMSRQRKTERDPGPSQASRPPAPQPAAPPIAPPPPQRRAPVIKPERPISGRVLNLRGEKLHKLEGPVTADISIDLQDCRNLSELPPGISTGTLNLTGCTSLEHLSAGLSVAFLDLAGCSALLDLPTDLRLRGGRLNLRGCVRLTHLPAGLGQVAQLDLSGCLNIHELPEGLTVTSWIDVGGSGIQTLPPRFDDAGIRWNGIAVSHRVAFHPETLDHAEILAERNAELRRVMIERFGYERLFEKAGAEELDRDSDAGGERRLLRMDVPNDEPLVCVSVRCPSTGHRFVLRVPPDMQTCRQAVAWTAGFDNPDAYRPAVET
jgi:hypothetical protein